MHLPTVLTVSLLINLIIGFFLLVLHRRRARERCFRLWGLSCLSFVLGGSMSAMRILDWPTLVTHFLANIFLVLAPFMVALGLVEFARVELSAPRKRQLAGLFLVVVCLLLLTHTNVALNGLLTSFVMAFFFFWCALLMRSSIPHDPLYSAVLRGVFSLHAVVMLFQGSLYGYHWQQNVFDVMPLAMILVLLSHILLTTLAAMLLPWLSFLQLERKLTLKSQRDGLTQLSNRNHFFELAERLWELHPDVPMAVMMIDIDNFKSINDRFGHAFGDEAIKSVASLVSRNMRKEDIVGRVGGEEFAALLFNREEGVAQKIADRLVQHVAEQALESELGEVSVTVSIGLVCVLPNNSTLESAFKIADDALYATKRGGRDGVTMGELVASV